MEEAVEFVRQKGVTGAARAAADEVLTRVGEAKSAVLAAPGALLHTVGGGWLCVGRRDKKESRHLGGDRHSLSNLAVICCGANAALPLPPVPLLPLPLAQVQQAVDRLLAFGPVNSAVEAAKPSLGAVSEEKSQSACAALLWLAPAVLGPVVLPAPKLSPLQCLCTHPHTAPHPTACPPPPTPHLTSVQAKGQYLRLHDSLVASQQYKQAYSLAGDFAQRAQQTWLVAAAKQRLMPLAQPAVDTGEQRLRLPAAPAHRRARAARPACPGCPLV